jgi:hypothetical protein
VLVGETNLRDQGVGGSSPLAPTNIFIRHWQCVHITPMLTGHSHQSRLMVVVIAILAISPAVTLRVSPLIGVQVLTFPIVR